MEHGWLDRACLNRPGIHFILWKLGLCRPQTQTTSKESELLKRLAEGKQCVLEIGVWHGVNTRIMAESLAEEGRLFAVDPFFAGRFGMRWHKWIATREVSKVNKREVRFVEKLSQDAVETLDRECPNGFDLIFIDGDHSLPGVSLDWEICTERLCSGGLIALHDSRSYSGRNIEHTDVVQFTNSVARRTPNMQIYDEVDSITVFQKRV